MSSGEEIVNAIVVGFLLLIGASAVAVVVSFFLRLVWLMWL